MPEDYNTVSITDANRADLNELVFTCVANTLASMSAYTKKQFTGVVWQAIYAKLDEFSVDKASMTHLLLIIDSFLEQNNCYLIEDLDMFLLVSLQV